MAESIFNRAKDLLGRTTPAAAPSKTPAAPPKKTNAHHAVAVAPGPNCCVAARKLDGRRFLSRDAPVLPLKDCNRTDCTCRYQHYEDRRRGPRRARDLGVAVDGYIEQDRRGEEIRGRRKADKR